MSRQFGNNIGTNWNDVVTTRYTAAIVGGKYSFAYWVIWRTNGQFGFGNSHSQANVFAHGGSNQAGKMTLYTGWSGAGGQFDWALVASNTRWRHICVTYDNSSASNIPVAYVDGVSVAVTTTQTPTGSAPTGTGALTVGGAGAGAAIDGMMAHDAHWNGIILTPSEVLSLASGMNPILIRPDSLVSYLPLTGTNSPEPDLIKNNTLSITGSKLGTSEPPVQPLLKIGSLLDYQTMAGTIIPLPWMQTTGGMMDLTGGMRN